MDDQGVFSILQVEEQVALTIYHHLCTEEGADFAKLKVRVPSTGERVVFSGSHRCDGHGADVTARRETNAFAKHLALFHPEHQGDITNFDIQVRGLFQKPLTRQKTEAIKIQSSQATHKMNSKAEQCSAFELS